MTTSLKSSHGTAWLVRDASVWHKRTPQLTDGRLPTWLRRAEQTVRQRRGIAFRHQLCWQRLGSRGETSSLDQIEDWQSACHAAARPDAMPSLQRQVGTAGTG
jgi:hypothetical protein